VSRCVRGARGGPGFVPGRLLCQPPAGYIMIRNTLLCVAVCGARAARAPMSHHHPGGASWRRRPTCWCPLSRTCRRAAATPSRNAAPPAPVTVTTRYARWTRPPTAWRWAGRRRPRHRRPGVTVAGARLRARGPGAPRHPRAHRAWPRQRGDAAGAVLGRGAARRHPRRERLVRGRRLRHRPRRAERGGRRRRGRRRGGGGDRRGVSEQRTRAGAGAAGGGDRRPRPVGVAGLF
jgi:hypothetical protein